jgi:hypothetical protein
VSAQNPGTSKPEKQLLPHKVLWANIISVLQLIAVRCLCTTTTMTLTPAATCTTIGATWRAPPARRDIAGPHKAVCLTTVRVCVRACVCVCVCVCVCGCVNFHLFPSCSDCGLQIRCITMCRKCASQARSSRSTAAWRLRAATAPTRRPTSLTSQQQQQQQQQQESRRIPAKWTSQSCGQGSRHWNGMPVTAPWLGVTSDPTLMTSHPCTCCVRDQSVLLSFIYSASVVFFSGVHIVALR